MAKEVIRQDVIEISFDIIDNPLKDLTQEFEDINKTAKESVEGIDDSLKDLKDTTKSVGKGFEEIQKSAKIDNILSSLDSDLGKFNTKLQVARDKFDSFKKSIKNITLHPIKTLNEAMRSLRQRVVDTTNTFKNLAKQKFTSITSGVKQITQKLTEGQSGIKGFTTALKNIGKIGIVKTVNGVKNLGTALKNVAKTGIPKLVSGLKTVVSKLTEIGKKAASTAFNGLKKVASISFKVLTAGIGAATVAVGSLVKSSVSAYADYEQLKGGIETLFKDSAGEVEKYANNAYKTAGLSANQYMETVTSFSASLLSSLKGDTQKATSYADMAITDMSDNANKMGTDMDSIIQTYQSLAKGNYAMLDNLKLGFGGTKGEMERLTREAAKHNKAIKANDLSYSNIVLAIHEIQDQMGITGPTAKEASTTITGSIASMKSAWQHLLPALIKGGDQFDQCVDNLIESIIGIEDETGKRVGGVINNLVPAIQKALPAVGKLIDSLAPTIAKEVPTLVTSLLPPLLSAAVQILQKISNSLPNLISTLLPIAINAVLQLLNGIISVLDTNAVQIINTILNGLMQATDSIISILPQFIQVGMRLIVALIVGIVQRLPELIPVLIQGFFTAIGALAEMTPEIFSGLWDAITSINWSDLGKSIITSIWEGVKGIGSSLWEGVKGLITGKGEDDLSSNGTSAGNSYASGLIESINNMPAPKDTILQEKLGFDLAPAGTLTANTYTTAVTTEIGAMDLTDEGKQTVEGLISGMKSMKPEAVKTARDIANAINAEYQKIQDIHSPSRVWEKFGAYQIQGNIKGIENNLPKLETTVQQAGESGMPRYSPESSTTTNNRTTNTTYSPSFVLNMNGASATDSNKRKVKRWIQEAITETFDGMGRANPQLIEV